MRNIPLFTTEFGVASLVLEEIPYKKCAYIKLQETRSPEQLLADCVAFCKAAGAEHIFATGHDYLRCFPVHTEIWKMTCDCDLLLCATAELVPVTEKSLDSWREIYNRRMLDIPNSATMTDQKAKELLESKDAYFVYRDDECIGIGKAKGDTVDAIISLIPGCGSDVMRSLCSVLTCNKVNVEVASQNISAVRLYQKLGFQHDTTLSKWFRVNKEL